MTTDVARTTHVIRNAKVGFVALRQPYTGKHGTSYSISLNFDVADITEENTELLGYMAKVLTKGGPVDVKEGLKSTGRFKLSFSSKENPIPVFDAKGKQIPQEQIPSMGEGTLVNVKFIITQTKRGVYKYIEGVQLVKLVEYVPSKPKVSFDSVDGFEFKEAEKIPEADFDSMFK